MLQPSRSIRLIQSHDYSGDIWMNSYFHRIEEKSSNRTDAL